MPPKRRDDGGPVGGPAFPSWNYDMQCDSGGMSLRDYFAAQALACMLNSRRFDSLHKAAKDIGIDMELDQQVAFACYRYADAMLAERSKP